MSVFGVNPRVERMMGMVAGILERFKEVLLHRLLFVIVK